jgi:hypothetical protein
MGKVSDFIINRLKKEQKPADKNKSRKYRFIILVFTAATVMCICPPVISVFFLKMANPLVILSGAEWITVMSMLGGLYFGANVIQKHLLKDEEIEISGKPASKIKPETLEPKSEPVAPAPDAP